ncbi:diacylglycerol/lipid kinase family protein [Nocardioides alcanivorans]|uniref:diacylglycerol/lipid kinase family protein n=1 Tax=Nocardioides alcanivorans TaxID=2897352 RepID=UPI001F3AF34F|nr:diacylglycerol kinase family protein [Nocardioides alcanivorans]
MQPLLVITNPDAGGPPEELERALAVLEARASVEVAETSNPGELDSVLHRAGSRTIVIAGGDGSLHAVVAALHKRRELDQQVLGLVPLGTGNDFARGTGIPLDPADAAAVVLSGVPTPTDLLVDEVGNVVVNHVHVGASAQAGHNGAKVKSLLGKVGLGKLGYPIGALISAVNPQVSRLRVEVDGEVINGVDQPVLMVSVGIGPDVGGGTTLTPDADPSDGKADVMVSRAVSRLAQLGYVARLGRGEHTERNDVVTIRGHQVTVSGEKFWTSADGELDGPERRRTWRVEPGAYQLLRPRQGQ